MENDAESLTYSQRKRGLITLREWLQRDFPFEYFVTFNFNADTSMQAARTNLKRFHARMDRKICGTLFHKKPLAERTVFIAFAEHLHSNLHFHALLHTPNPQVFLTQADAIWQKLIPSGELWIEKVTAADIPMSPSKTRLVNYVTKEMASAGNYSGFILSNEFMP